jgi:hypothetical protein
MSHERELSRALAEIEKQLMIGMEEFKRLIAKNERFRAALTEIANTRDIDSDTCATVAQHALEQE